MGDIGPSPTNPRPVWTKFLEYPFDFPERAELLVGQSRWTTDGISVQPVVVDSTGNYNGSTSTITFNLASAPRRHGLALHRLCLGLSGPLIVQVNGNNLVGSSGDVTLAGICQRPAISRL